MPHVLFIETRIIQDENRENIAERTVYEAGKIYNLPQESIDRWVQRGVATVDKELLRSARQEMKEEKEEEIKEEVKVEVKTEAKSEDVKIETKLAEAQKAEVTSTVSGARAAPNALTSSDVRSTVSGGRR